MFTVRRSAAAVLLGAALVLSACDGGGDPETTDTPPVSDGGGVLDDRPGAGEHDGEDVAASDGGGSGEGDLVATDVPAPDPADYPGMDENTPEGAEQAFKYYIAVLMWSAHSGDTNTLNSLHTDECENCVGFAEEIEARRKNGALWTEANVSGGKTSIHDSENFDLEVGYSYEIGAHSEPDLETGEDDQVGVTEMISIGGLNWDGGAWVVEGYASEVQSDG